MAGKDFSDVIQNHILVPKHTKLSDKEEKTFLEKHKVEKNNLPKIMIDDPSIIHQGVKLGDIIKIERQSPTAGISYFYRVVSNE
jgi:DNA-directed RNA polymerase subunit H